ncbi:hypothetical protein [Gordonia sp. NPDC003585]|uniref:hypothetical protein n=1 Tax=unclassified Gordonia (in: high G+C Gram-positive bacteria) TaxID=2657482 RepID=UPI0033BDD94D
MKRIVSGALAGTAAVALFAAPVVAQADPLTDLINALSAGSSSAPGPQGGQPGNPSANGVASIVTKVGAWHGRSVGPDQFDIKQFRPGVTWSARDRSNAEVKGEKCQIEISFPGTDRATYKTAVCSGWVGFSVKYPGPGTYSIKVKDVVSGASSTTTFKLVNGS